MAAPVYEPTAPRRSRLRILPGGRASSLLSTFDNPRPPPGFAPRYSVDAVLRQLDTLKSQRSSFDNYWQRVAERVWPEVADFLTQATTPGEQRTQYQYDMTAALALEKFSAILESLMVPRAQKWHELRASDPALNRDGDVKEWFGEVRRILFDARQAPRANYYGAMQVGFKSLGAFGNDCLFVEEDAGNGVAYANTPVHGVWMATNHRAQVDTIFHQYQLTAKAAEQRFGRERLPDRIVTALEKNPYLSFEFVRCVKPRGGEYDPEREDAVGMRYVAIEIALEDRHTIDEGGYHELPYIYSRYTLNPRESYGRGPAMMVLPDILTLQEMQRTFIRTGHKIADPPILAYDDDEIGNGGRRVDMRPGAINRGGLDERGNPRLVPFEIKGQIQTTAEMIERERHTINDAFLVTLFQVLVESPNMTATEALLRAQEKGQLIAPTIGRQQSEKLGPQIEREMGLLARAGMLPPPPPALVEARGQYHIEYVSPATRMQRTEEVLGFQRTMEVVLPLAQADPSVLENFDADEVLRGTSDIMGVPAKWIRDPEKVAMIREAQRKAAAEQRALEAAPVIASTAKDAASAAQSAGLSGRGA